LVNVSIINAYSGADSKMSYFIKNNDVFINKKWIEPEREKGQEIPAGAQATRERAHHRLIP
jgi:hypothetical protein